MPGTDGHRKSQRRYLILWLILSVSATAILGGVLALHDHSTLLRWSVFLSIDLDRGRVLFKDKPCIQCHSINGVGGKLGPDLGEQPQSSSLPFLVTAMWNHAPHMWEYMREAHVSYPTFTYEQTAQLVAYLYMARHLDSAGDPQHGRLLFASDGCDRCHSLAREKGKLPLESAGAATLQSPMAWSQAMWNAAPAMNGAMRKAGLSWPKLNDSDLNDLFAFVRQNVEDPVVPQQFPGNPERGWQVFQSKGCIECHAPREQDRSRPENWPSRTFTQVVQLMWNQAPVMAQAMREKGQTPPRFTGEEMADLAAFVYALRYFDPPGSAIVGRSVFRWRGCSRCHGEEAQGTRIAPALRGHGTNYNSISLATALWNHGHKMFQRSQQLGFGWPTLQESDVGDLLAFLNAPEEKHQP